MNKRTLHFVYPVPQPLTPLQWAYNTVRKQKARAQRRYYAPWRDGDLDFNHGVPLSAPISITTAVLDHLQKSYDVLVYDWLETNPTLTYGPDDVILGHLAPQPNTVMQRFVTCDKPSAAKILLQPFAHRILEDTAFILPALPRVAAFAAICGPFWIDTIAQSPFARHKNLVHRVDMAVNIQHYPQLKRTFNILGQRRFLYIGHNHKPAKGCSYLSTLAGALPMVEFGWIGDGGRIPHVRHISKGRRLTPDYMSSVCKEYDFLITMGVSDANPTTILEAMAWGLPVVCTPQSGYYNSDEVFTVELDDLAGNIALIARLQEMPESELISISRKNRQRVTEFYTWQRFCTTVDEVIHEAIERRMLGNRAYSEEQRNPA